MRKVPVPSLDAREVFVACASQVRDLVTREQLLAYVPEAVSNASNYNQLALRGSLFEIPSVKLGPSDLVFKGVTRDQFQKLYKQQLRRLGTSARKNYDVLLSGAPFGKCPYCGFGQASTLDHYLPSIFFPLYVVTPQNLIPACSNCQTEKLSDFAESYVELPLHPYFEEEKFVNDRWLGAKIETGQPPVATFHVKRLDDWSDVDLERVRNHMNSFGLDRRYAVEAAEEFVILKESLRHLIGAPYDQVSKELAYKATSVSRVHVNSWRVALYESLSNLRWYCEGGHQF